MADVRIKDFANEASSPADDDYVALDGATNGSRKFKGSSIALRNDANISCHVITTNPEYVYSVTDSNGVFLFGVKNDGSVEWPKGIPEHVKSIIEDLSAAISANATAVATKVDKVAFKSLVNATFADGVSVVSNDEWVLAFVDAKDRLLFGVKNDGSVEWGRVDESLINAEFAESVQYIDNSEYNEVITDSDGKVIEGIGEDGKHFFNKGVKWSSENIDELSSALQSNGFTRGIGNWSDKDSLEIPVPEMATVNFTNISQMPQTKTENAEAIMEFWDMNGNYFKKKVIANAQGSSSLSFSKKNIAVDICNDDWVGDDTFSIKFGDWVAQDSFHLKAYASDYFRCIGLVGYDFVKKVLDTRTPNATWKQAVDYGTDPVAQKNVDTQIDSGALCYPQGFPCKVYLNGSFYGLFCWQIKKHRDNYNMNKKNATHIHLDGMLGGSFFGGSIDWTAFEVRNPKNLITYSGEDYDGENPTELIDATSSAYDSTNSKHKLTAKVKQYIIDLSNRMAEIGSDKALFEKYFGVESCVDYAILSDVLYNYDYVKNAQWTTWDGVKWFVNPYDLDCTLGANSAGDGIHYPTNAHVTVATNHPLRFVVNNYVADLETRWENLRNAGVIEARSIYSILENYVRLFGSDGYEKEYEKWTDSKCNRDPVIDTDNWEMEIDDDGNPVIYTTNSNAWSSSSSYSVGDIVQYNLTGSSVGNFGWWYRFTAKNANTNKPPITRTGFKDNIYRVFNWLNKQISNMDKLYNYTQGE